MARQTNKKILISPSLLACDFGRLAEEVQQVQEAGADWLHVDVMDGHFVPNVPIGPVVVEAIRRASRIPLDVHLMMDHPEQYLKPFIDAGAEYLTVHVEAPGLKGEAMRTTLDTIKQLGARPGVSVRPRTSVDTLAPFKDLLELVLVMSVEPGFGGQAFMPEAIPKVRQLRAWYTGHLAVDGGINADTGRQMREAGADVLVAGTYVFRSTSYEQSIQSLRGV